MSGISTEYVPVRHFRVVKIDIDHDVMIDEHPENERCVVLMKYNIAGGQQ